jgi:hypothetical protein
MKTSIKILCLLLLLTTTSCYKTSSNSDLEITQSVSQWSLAEISTNGTINSNSNGSFRISKNGKYHIFYNIDGITSSECGTTTPKFANQIKITDSDLISYVASCKLVSDTLVLSYEKNAVDFETKWIASLK